jgi:hypothetical protein
MRTVQDYMNDPRIVNDKGLMDGPEEIRKIHAIRLKLQDETAGMTTAEFNAYSMRKLEKLFEDTGYTPEIVNLSGQGKLKRREAATV